MRTLSQLIHVAAALAMSAGALFAAQEGKPEAKSAPLSSPSPAAEAPRRGVRPGDVQRVFILKYLGLNDTARMLKVFPTEISGMDDGKTRVLSVSGAPAVVAAIEETLKRLDVPPPPSKNVEVTAYVLECATSGDAGSLPPDLQDVVAQLKRTFNYSGCGLARTLFTRTSAGSRINSEFKEGSAGFYHLSIAAPVELDATETSTVRFRSLTLENVGPNQGGRFTGDVEVRDGQKVVLGRLGTVPSGKDQLIVLTAHILP